MFSVAIALMMRDERPHQENPKPPDRQPRHDILIETDILEEALEAPVTRGMNRLTRQVASRAGQIDRAAADHCDQNTWAHTRSDSQ